MLGKKRGAIIIVANEWDLRKNAEGYSDPTAYEAIKRLDNDSERLDNLLKAIFAVCEASDFHVEERIVLKDTRTGKIYR